MCPFTGNARCFHCVNFSLRSWLGSGHPAAVDGLAVSMPSGSAEAGLLSEEVTGRLQVLGFVERDMCGGGGWVFEGREVSGQELQATIERVIARMAEAESGISHVGSTKAQEMRASRRVLGTSSLLRGEVLSRVGSIHHLLSAARVNRAWRRTCDAVVSSGALTTLDLSRFPTVRDSEVVWMLRRFFPFVAALDFSFCKELTDTPLVELLHLPPSLRGEPCTLRPTHPDTLNPQP